MDDYMTEIFGALFEKRAIAMDLLISRLPEEEQTTTALLTAAAFLSDLPEPVVDKVIAYPPAIYSYDGKQAALVAYEEEQDGTCIAGVVMLLENGAPTERKRALFEELKSAAH